MGINAGNGPTCGIAVTWTLAQGWSIAYSGRWHHSGDATATLFCCSDVHNYIFTL